MELMVRAVTVEVSNGVIIGVKEQASQVIVVMHWTLELLEISRSPY